MAIERILETEVMDTEEDAIEYDSMDFIEVNSSFAERAIELCPPSGCVLDIGTGTARIPILMLQKSHGILHVDAIDLAQRMLDVAKINVAKAGLVSRIHLKLADATKLVGTEKYHLVMSNSLVHHLPNPSDFFRNVSTLAGESGGIFIRDLFRPESVEELDRLVALYAGDADPHQQKLFRDSLHAALTLDEVQGQMSKAEINNALLMKISDRHWSLERAWQAK